MNFDIKGYFYKDDRGSYCRKYLDITAKNSNKTKPQLMIVMMNPGSSKPLSGIHDGRILTSTKPDPTQYQIMQIMDKKNIQFARVLNLSDLIEPRSSTFYSKIKYSRKDTEHSIFDSARKHELEELFIKDVPTLFAWGVNSSLNKLTNLAVEELKISNPLGIQKNNNKFYHARPRLKKSQEEWLLRILEQMDQLKFD